MAVATVSVTVTETTVQPTRTEPTEPTVEPTAEPTDEPQAPSDPNRVVTAPELHAAGMEALAEVESYEFHVKLNVNGKIDDGWAGIPVEGYVMLVGRYVGPGVVWVRTVLRHKVRHDAAAGGDPGTMVELESGGFPGVEAIVGEKEVYVRYLGYENEEPVPDRRPEPVGAAPVTGWYRLKYENWPKDLPDVFADPSGTLVRLLPKLASGFPPLGEDEDRWGLQPRAEEIDRRRAVGLWAPFGEFYYPAEELHRRLSERDTFNQPARTGVTPVGVVVSHALRRSDNRPVFLHINVGESSLLPSEGLVYFHYPEGGADPIEIPEEYVEFDRQAHEELR